LYILHSAQGNLWSSSCHMPLQCCRNHSCTQNLRYSSGCSLCELWQASLDNAAGCTAHQQACRTCFVSNVKCLKAHLASMDVLDLTAATQLPQFFSRLFISEPHSAWHCTKQWMCSCTFCDKCQQRSNNSPAAASQNPSHSMVHTVKQAALKIGSTWEAVEGSSHTQAQLMQCSQQNLQYLYKV